MGDLIQFPHDRVRPMPVLAPAPPAFFFDLADPFSYLAAERVERLLGDVEWVAVDGAGLGDRPTRGRALARLRERAETRAAELRLPLVWPERFPDRTPAALRAAAFAGEHGAGQAFALAAARLAFCGGFALDDPEVLAEAAAAAGLGLGAVLEAAGDRRRDAELAQLAADLGAAGVTELPAFGAAGRFSDGEAGLATAARRLSAPTLRRRPPATG